MFAGNRGGLSFRMKDGDKVEVTGSVEVFERDGRYQIYAKEITLAGSFCSGKCNRTGVTVTVDDQVIPGVNRENFKEFFETHVMGALKKDGR